jgi:signal transduction histidine kinase
MPNCSDALRRSTPKIEARVQLLYLLADGTEIANAPLLVQVMQNLLTNALRYSSGEVLLSAEARGQELLLSVRDFGPGVPEGTLKSLTRPFYRRGRHHESLAWG